MAERLNQFYDEAQKLGGLKAKIQLAVITKTPSAKAAKIEDTVEIIRVFKEAMDEKKKNSNKQVMATVIKHEIEYDHQFDQKTNRHYINGIVEKN